MQKSVVTILSTNYAGSHFLSSMLGSHSQAIHLGEILHLRKPAHGHVACTRCGRDGVECPVFKGIDASTIDRAYEVAFGNGGSDKAVLIDCSKYVRWAESFVGRTPFAMKYIHLIRDPRALVRKWWYVERITSIKRLKRRYKTARRWPRFALRALFSGIPAVYQWLGQNQDITDFIGKHKVDHLRVTYRDLALDPEGEVRRVQEWIGAPFEPAQLDYAAHGLHGSQKPEYEKKSGRYFDTRWKTELPGEIQTRIANHRGVLNYLESMGLRMVEDGLTRKR